MCLAVAYPGRVGAAWQRPNTLACFIDDVRLPAKADGYQYSNQQLSILW
jgi:hypothetical protein